MKNNTQRNCGLAGTVFIGLSALLGFILMAFTFAERVFYSSVLSGVLELLRFILLAVAFAFALVSVIGKENKPTMSIVTVIMLLVSAFWLPTSYFGGYGAVGYIVFCSKIIEVVAVIVYLIYFVGLMMALKKDEKQGDRQVPQFSKPNESFENRVQRLTECKRMLDEGIISQEEFIKLKSEILG